MSRDGTRVLDAGTVIAQDPVQLPVLEGPKLYKRDGWYYIFAPIGGVGKTGSQAVGRARNIAGPYQWRVAAREGRHADTGTTPGGVTSRHQPAPAGSCTSTAPAAFGRIVYLEPVQWHDGWPVIGSPVAGETFGQPVTSAPLPVNLPMKQWAAAAGFR